MLLTSLGGPEGAMWRIRRALTAHSRAATVKIPVRAVRPYELRFTKKSAIDIRRFLAREDGSAASSSVLASRISERA